MMVTNGAGPCVIASDMISTSRSLSLARLGQEGTDRLKRELLPFCVIGNPVDLTGSADAHAYLQALGVMAEDPGVDILMPVFVFQDAPLGFSADELEGVMAAIRKKGKPILAVAGGGPFTRKHALGLQKAGVPVFPTATRAVAALDGFVRHAIWRMN